MNKRGFKDVGDLVHHTISFEGHPIRLHAIRTIQGYSNRLADPVALGWRKPETGETKFLFHLAGGGWREIRDQGLLPGRMLMHTGKVGRPEMYFTGQWMEYGGSAQTLKPHTTKGSVVVVIDAEQALEADIELWVTQSHAVLLSCSNFVGFHRAHFGRKPLRPAQCPALSLYECLDVSFASGDAGKTEAS